MQKVIKQWLAWSLVLGAFVSCSQENSQPTSSSQMISEGETVISLDAEVSVDDPEMRAIDYRLGNNAKGQLVPMPTFTDKQVVPVHTILKSNKGAVVAQTVNWRYDLKTRKLVLRPNDGHSITVSNFNNDNSTKWYISGMIGGTLQAGTTQVNFQGTRSLRGVAGASGDVLGNLEVPYAFGWVELIIDKTKAKDSNNSYSSAKVPVNASIKFSPLGSLIAYTLGNAHGYNFTPNGFVVRSNSWGDKGVFELNREIPSTNAASALPTWTEASATSSMVYTFASGQAPGTIANGANASKIYYAWAMPHTTQPTTVSSRVNIKGTSDRPTTSTYKDYTNTWPTNYTPKTTGSAGRIVTGKVHKLTATITGAIIELPFDYVTPYNLAGGKSVQTDATPDGAGVSGEFRFAMSHDNDKSGYYVGYMLNGDHDSNFNPERVDIRNQQLRDLDGKLITWTNRYHIPTREEWSLFFPKTTPQLTFGASKQLDLPDVISYGYNKGGTYTSDFSETFTSGTNQINYAIRFKGSDMKLAYRFTRAGDTWEWESGSWGFPSDPTQTRWIVDVVYLGDEATPTTLEQISTESWWTARRSRIIQNIFPMVGSVYTGNAIASTNTYIYKGRLQGRNEWGGYHTYTSYWSYSNQFMNPVHPSRSGVVEDRTYYHHARAIRLFKNWWAF